MSCAQGYHAKDTICKKCKSTHLNPYELGGVIGFGSLLMAGAVYAMWRWRWGVLRAQLLKGVLICLLTITCQSHRSIAQENKSSASGGAGPCLLDGKGGIEGLLFYFKEKWEG